MYSPGVREAGMVLVQLLLLAMSWPWAQVPLSTVPDMRPASSILNYMKETEDGLVSNINIPKGNKARNVYPIQGSRVSRRARPVAIGHVDHDGSEVMRPLVPPGENL